MTDTSSSAKRIARLVDLYAPGVWDWETSTNTFTVTDRFRQIFGLPPSNQIGGAPIDFDAILNLTHPEDRKWAEPLRSPSREQAPYLTVRYRINRQDGETRWISSRIWAHEGATPAGYTGSVVDITEEVATADALAQSEQRLRYAIEAGKMAVWEVDLETGGLTQSPELNHLFGYPPDMFMTLEKARACYNPGEIERLAAENHTAEAVRDRAAAGSFALRAPGVRTSGDDRTQLQAELAITAKTGEPKRLMLRAQYAAAPDGRPRLTGLLFDITETKMAEERSAVVARELQHRVKNSLTVIGALATQSLRGKTNAETGLKDFQSRLMALSAANDLILSDRSGTVSLHDLVKKITQPYHTGVSPFAVDGPAVTLQGHTATSIGMVLHELCTNAVKYGALTVPGGLVSIDWTTQAAKLQLTWREQNGPAAMVPTRNGFGLRLLDNVIKSDLGGTLAVEFEPAGLSCRFEIAHQR